MEKLPVLLSFEDRAELQNNLRDYVLNAKDAALKHRTVFRVGVSGGSLPAVLASALLADTSSVSAVEFEKWQIFFADERAVSIESEESNYWLLKKELLDKIPENIVRPKVFPITEAEQENVDDLVEKYDNMLIATFASKDSVKIPVFDLLLLGCGPDGHTCSLFPDSSLLDNKDDGWVLPVTNSPKPPPNRVTLSLSVVCGAAKIAFVATGAEKNKVLREIFDTKEGAKLPCGRVNGTAKNRVTWFTDTLASKDIVFPTGTTPRGGK